MIASSSQVARLHHQDRARRFLLAMPPEKSGTGRSTNMTYRVDLTVDLQALKRAGRARVVPADDMCVNLGGFYIVVTQQLLNGTYICTSYQQMRCKGVTERMRRTPSSRCQQQSLPVAAPFVSTCFQYLPERQRKQGFSVLVALAIQYRNTEVRKIHIHDAQTKAPGNTQPASMKYLEN